MGKLFYAVIFTLSQRWLSLEKLMYKGKF